MLLALVPCFCWDYFRFSYLKTVITTFVKPSEVTGSRNAFFLSDSKFQQFEQNCDRGADAKTIK